MALSRNPTNYPGAFATPEAMEAYASVPFKHSPLANQGME